MAEHQHRYSAKDRLVQDALGEQTIAMCRDAETARGIAMALNAADAVPTRFKLPALPEPMPPAECVDSAARQYLIALDSWSRGATGGPRPNVPWQDE
jgi:hypothetical protein